MNRRSLLIAPLTFPLAGCLYDKTFDLEWDEEVQLASGKVVVVHVKHSYERMSASIFRYGGHNVHRDTTITFDAGSPVGTVTQLLKGGQPALLENDGGTWYLVFFWSPYTRSRATPGQDWGPAQNRLGHRVAVLTGTKFEPSSICRLSEKFAKPNLIVPMRDVEELATIDKRKLTLEEKTKWVSAHPLPVGATSIPRPSHDSLAKCP